ncbi:RHTO0S10e04016g1_1 [Rhodotorula toruloides]|uniref:RHTO0S10e04016g1_1 n=2 Tax=Rhodotorula toruloides TaxID=5286 RepID=A0A061B4W7_RHOTO|nr:uncharacterized protein RHTO_05347 [Rhodotorula toruloides NP11]EMS18975.1 hypothetical protein RHTO_05347 [Rhodotorula toruloides NP11]CDR44996.1 RHTO0S10e04016g1_1 [Rhodotorula toruloides]
MTAPPHLKGLAAAQTAASQPDSPEETPILPPPPVLISILASLAPSRSHSPIPPSAAPPPRALERRPSPRPRPETGRTASLFTATRSFPSFPPPSHSLSASLSPLRPSRQCARTADAEAGCSSPRRRRSLFRELDVSRWLRCEPGLPPPLLSLLPPGLRPLPFQSA